MYLLKPKYFEEFENMCCDFLSNDYNKRFQKYGRHGVNQHGIDLFHTNDFSTVAQCKNHINQTPSPKVFLSEIKSDYDRAMEHLREIGKPLPNEFIAMTSLDSDPKIQENIDEIGNNLHVIFWEEISDKIYNNKVLLIKYYKDFMVSKNDICIPRKYINKIISLLEELKKEVDYFHNCSHHKTGVFENSDEQMFNTCITMFQNAAILNDKVKKYILQLNINNKLGNYIHDIIFSLPESASVIAEYLENKDINDDKKDYVINDFLSYYQDDETYDILTSNCQEAIDEIQKVPSD